MAEVQETRKPGETVYSLKGSLLEACSCNVNCPCWIGEDPDLGYCYAIVGYAFDEGVIDGIDVSGLSLVFAAQIPGNVLAGNWAVVALVDDRATDEQREAILGAFTGQLGGPLADLYQVIGEVKGVEVVPIRHGIKSGIGSLEIPGIMETHMEPYRGPDGSPTTLQNSIFSTVPGSPAWVGKASLNRVELPQYGMSWEYEGKNSTQAEWTMEHVA
jgi:hypothetical protein